jgi:CubicO group peptidase (beta-lactamase class C family)
MNVFRMVYRVGGQYFYALTLTILCASSCARALAAEPDIEQRIKTRLVPPVLVKGESPALMPLSARMEELHVPAVSIAVIRKGKLVWAGGFGTKDLEGHPVTTETLFQAGSISKPVTAAAVLELAQAHELDLDADVNQYLRSWKLPSSLLTDHNPVTVRELLSHSAGVNNSGYGGYEAGQPLPTLVQVLNGEPPAYKTPVSVDVAPGTIWRYSGGGYVIVQQTLIDITQIPFSQLLHEKVLLPFGMTQSGFQQPLPPELLVRAATPYAADGTPVRGGPHVYPEMAPAGLWTTASDLARFAIGIQRALSGLLGGPLSRESARTMVSPVPGGVTVPFRSPHQAGHGFILGGKTDYKYFEHHGGNAGYSAYLMAYESGDGVAIMTNTSSDDVLRLIDDIVRTVAYTYKWPDLGPLQRTRANISSVNFDRYAGAYRSPSGDLVTFWRNDRQLKSRIWGQASSEILPASTREYFSRTNDMTWTFGETRGTATSVTLNRNDVQQSFARLEDREGRTAVERSVEIEKRVGTQTPSANSEQALIEVIGGLKAGEPNYDHMSPEFANVVRRGLSGVQAMFAALGSVQSISFRRVLANGRDVYHVAFQHGSQDMEILMAPDGRIHTVLLNR